MVPMVLMFFAWFFIRSALFRPGQAIFPALLESSWAPRLTGYHGVDLHFVRQRVILPPLTIQSSCQPGILTRTPALVCQPDIPARHPSQTSQPEIHECPAATTRTLRSVEIGVPMRQNNDTEVAEACEYFWRVGCSIQILVAESRLRTHAKS